jgi:acetylglutamate synthase
MTFAEAHEKIDVIIDKHDLPWFEPEEKDIFLNFAQQEFVNQRYSEFEVNEKRRQDIRTLITTFSAGAVSSITVPSDMLFVLSLKGTFNVVVCGQTVERETHIRPMQHDDVNKIINDPFNVPTNDEPVYVTNANTLTILSDNTAISTELTYIKEPLVIDAVTNPTGVFSTPTYTHNEIVNIAVRKILGSIEQQNYNLQINEIDNQE